MDKIGKLFTINKRVRKFKKLDIYSDIIPVYYLSKCAGLAPVSLAHNRDKGMRVSVTLKTSILGITYTVFLLMIITGAQSCVLMFHHRLPFKVERIHLHVLEVLIMGIASVTSLITCLIRIRKEMDILLHKISVLDEIFDTKCDDQGSNEKYLRIQILSLIIIVCVTYTSDFLTFNTGFAALILCITTYICNFINIVTITQFVNLVFLLKQKFLILNKFLVSAENPTEQKADGNLWEVLLQTSVFRNVTNFEHDPLRTDAFYQAITRRCYNSLQTSTGNSAQNYWLHKGTLRFRALRVIHDVLCDVCTAANSMYGLQIFLCMVSAFIETATNISYSVTSTKLEIRTNEDLFSDKLYPLLWALVHFLQLFVITGSCNAASEEADRTGNLLQKLLLLPELHPATLNEIRLFSQQVSNRKLRFTAWGLFTINYTILGSIVGAITTLLLILVQLQDD
jgi:gustatory receptor